MNQQEKYDFKALTKGNRWEQSKVLTNLNWNSCLLVKPLQIGKTLRQLQLNPPINPNDILKAVAPGR